jgi:hypothetical protein
MFYLFASFTVDLEDTHVQYWKCSRWGFLESSRLVRSALFGFSFLNYVFLIMEDFGYFFLEDMYHDATFFIASGAGLLFLFVYYYISALIHARSLSALSV